MEDDNDGLFDDSGAGLQREPGENQTELDAKGKKEPCEKAKDDIEVQPQELTSREEELVAAANFLADAEEEELEAIGIISVSETREMSFSGLLPHPDIFEKYAPEFQERICQWNDSFSVDESVRQDLLVENEVKQSNRGQIISSVLLFMFAIMAFIAFMITENPWSFSMLAVPVLNVLMALSRRSNSKSSRKE